MSNNNKKKEPNDTSKEERTYEPFQGAKLDFIKKLEEDDNEENVS